MVPTHTIQASSPWLDHAPRFYFFTGKGGVGKTSLACASALVLADSGKRVLLVGTDPASNLDEVLDVKLGRQPAPVPAVAGLFAMNIAPAEAAAAYREKIIGPMRGLLPEAALRSMEEQLSGACTMEIAAFDEFSRLLGEPGAAADFDHVIFDTAPTGHTLRLLALPKAWTGFFADNTSGTSCLGPLAGLDKQRTIYETALASLADAARTVVVLVSRAQTASLTEAARTSAELGHLGIANQTLILNGIFTATAPDDPVAAALAGRQESALAGASAFLAGLPVHRIALRPHNLLGVPALRNLLAGNDVAFTIAGGADLHESAPQFTDLEELLKPIAAAGRGVIMTMGKGGVGKTTVAAAVAVWLARQGHKVALSTTDPAAHVTAALGEEVAGLTLGRIDPAVETAAYVRQVLAEKGVGLDAESLALLEEDLRSPCTEEIAVFRAFARTVAGAKHGFVVLDTAPTGHTLLLLDASQSYQRELNRQSRSSDSVPEEVSELLPRLRNPDYTRVFLVTLPEATPVHEAAALQDDLRRAGIEPAAWVVNQSFVRLDLRDPLLRERARREIICLREVQTLSREKAALIDWQLHEPVGPAALEEILSGK
ncbi:MAG: arsenical pump-driving ATPase [Verrucomicrobiae bacterium]